MALFPDPARIVRPCDDLWVPIVIVNSNIHIFPGIPYLFERLLDGFQPHLLEVVGQHGQYHREQIVTSHPEGVIATVLTEIQEKVVGDRIKIGSYPNWFNQNVVVSVVGKDEARVKEVAEEIKVKIDGWPFVSDK